MAEARPEQRGPMWRRLQPGGDDVARGHLAPRPGVEVLPEAGIAVSGRGHRRRKCRAARRVRELPAGRDALALERGGPLQRGAPHEPSSAILRARPVHEARDRTHLDGERRRRSLADPTSRVGCEVGAPGTSRAVGSSGCEQHENERDSERSRDETDRCCRRRRSHGSHRARHMLRGSLPWPGDDDVPRLSDPAPRQGSHGATLRPLPGGACAKWRRPASRAPGSAGP